MLSQVSIFTGPAKFPSDVSFLGLAAAIPLRTVSVSVFSIGTFVLPFLMTAYSSMLLVDLFRKTAVVWNQSPSSDVIVQKLGFWIFSLLWCLGTFCLGCLLLWMTFTMDVPHDAIVGMTWWSCGTAALFLDVGACIIVAKMISGIFSRVSILRKWQPKLGQEFYLILFALTNLVVTCLYYSIEYSPEGTVKPAWTENLG